MLSAIVTCAGSRRWEESGRVAMEGLELQEKGRQEIGERNGDLFERPLDSSPLNFAW
jgi:hypothetical protein